MIGVLRSTNSKYNISSFEKTSVTETTFKVRHEEWRSRDKLSVLRTLSLESAISACELRCMLLRGIAFQVISKPIPSMWFISTENLPCMKISCNASAGGQRRQLHKHATWKWHALANEEIQFRAPNNYTYSKLRDQMTAKKLKSLFKAKNIYSRINTWATNQKYLKFHWDRKRVIQNRSRSTCWHFKPSVSKTHNWAGASDLWSFDSTDAEMKVIVEIECP